MPLELERLYDSVLIKKYHQTFPSLLFHYTKANTSCAIITSHEFRLSKYDKSNDVFEFSHGLNLISDVITQIQSLGEKDNANILWDKFFKWFPEEREKPSTFYYMGSFTIQDNKHLWRKYADNYRGRRLSFEFNSKDLIPHPFVAGQVLYSQKKFKKKIRRIIYLYADIVIARFAKWQKDNSYDENMKLAICLMIRDLFIAAAFFKKHKHSIEKEYRIIVWGSNEEKVYEPLMLNWSSIFSCDYSKCRR